MRVVYLLNGTALYGGVKVVFQHALALRELGVVAEVVSPDPAPVWYPEAAGVYRQVRDLEPESVGPADIAVGTIWFTVPAATRVPGAVPFHLCQCYEPDYEGAAAEHEAMAEVYRLPTRKLAISRHLQATLRDRLGVEAEWIPQPFRPAEFHPPASERLSDGTLRVMLTGQWGLPIKGVAWAMSALQTLCNEAPRLRLVRLSQDAPDEEIAAWPEAERHINLPPAEVPDLVRGIDVFLGPSTAVEGFGLPTLEAMGCGRPCILTDIGAARDLDPRGVASLRIAVGDDAALRAAVRRLRDPETRRRLGNAGRTIAAEFTEERTARALLAAFEKALTTAAR